MNKIIFQIGLLIFCFSVIYFVQKGFSVDRVILNSLAIFIFITIMLSLITLGLIKAINKNSFEKINNYTQDLTGTNKNE